MKKRNNWLRRFSKEDFVRAAAIYGIIVFLFVFLACPLVTLFF